MRVNGRKPKLKQSFKFRIPYSNIILFHICDTVAEWLRCWLLSLSELTQVRIPLRTLFGYKARSIVTGPTRPSSLEAGSYTGYQAELNIKARPGRVSSSGARVTMQQCLLVRSCLAGSAPSYLAELCIPVSSVTGRRQNLRSASRGTLVVPRVRTERYGRRGFSVSGPHLWNSLPPRIRSLIEKPDLFKRELKHYLMQQQS